MDFKKLEKAINIYKDIQAIDKEITDLDRFAMMVVNGDTESSIQLKIVDIGKQEDDSPTVSFGEDGSLVRPRLDWGTLFKLRMTPFSYGSCELKNTSENEHCINYSLSENSMLQILGVLLCGKQEKRKELISQLERLGVSASVNR